MCAGWLVLCKALFRRGEVEQAFTQVGNGAAEGWAPDSSLFERMAAALGARGDVAGVEDTIATMEELGVIARTAHYNHLVRAVAIAEGALLGVCSGFPSVFSFSSAPQLGSATGWSEAVATIDMFPGHGRERGNEELTAHPVRPTRETYNIIIREALVTARAAPAEAYRAEYLRPAPQTRLEVLAARNELSEPEKTAWARTVGRRFEDDEDEDASGGVDEGLTTAALAVAGAERHAGGVRSPASYEGRLGATWQGLR